MTTASTHHGHVEGANRRLMTVAWTCLTILLSACGPGSSDGPRGATGSAAEVPSPTDDLYEAPSPLELAPPGTLIWAEAVDLEMTPPSSVWRMLYHSRSREDRDIAVSGYAIVPDAPVPAAGGRPVYAWAHGTVGLGDQCAPSHDVRENLPPYGGETLGRGAILVATDYEGLGTPGTPTSTVAAAEGHALLDSVRAVAALPNAGELGDVILSGHSQGGRAALIAAEIARAYSPELKLVGAVALAPGVELAAHVDHLAASPHPDVMLPAAIGLHAGYPDLELATVFTPAVIADVARIESECVDETVDRYESISTGDVISHPPSEVPDLQAILEENSPGRSAPSVSLFIAHGDADEQVPVGLSERTASRYCALHVAVTRHVYRGVDHDEVMDAARDDALAFIAERYDHKRAIATRTTATATTVGRSTVTGSASAGACRVRG
jgi:hypothetical protein